LPNMKLRKKLIEVALPLEAINTASAKEKSIRYGHPSTLHLWWARRPLAAARAVIFAQMVDDPSSWPDLFPSEKAQDKERKRLFGIIEELVKWENTTNEPVQEAARQEIWRSWRRTCAENADHPRAKELFDRHKLPAFHDPFAGGGTLPLEAQRLGLESYASDLNPVAVLINKAMIEIPPQFAGRPPINPEWQRTSAEEKTLRQWKGTQGLAEDVRYYGKWMRAEAEKRIGHLYPKIEITAETTKTRPDLNPYLGKKLTVIAWLWARTVKSPNPAFSEVDVPLASTFILSTKPGKETYIEPVIESGGYRFVVRVGKPKDKDVAENGTKLSRGANFRCIMSDAPMAGDYIKSEGRAGRIDARLMAIVAEGDKGRIYLSPTQEHESIARTAKSSWKPETSQPDDPRNFWTVQYGLATFGDLFTTRQLVSLNSFSDLVAEARIKIRQDAIAAGYPSEASPEIGSDDSVAHANAISTYLALGLSRLSDAQNALCQWGPGADQTQHLFRRQAIPMVWDFAESSVFSGAAGDLVTSIGSLCRVLELLGNQSCGHSMQVDAQNQQISENKVVSTDPPYYDNIGYADLSDFFYVWLRRALRPFIPELFDTLEVPKTQELVATPYRHNGKENAEAFFLHGMTKAMNQIASQAHQAFPVTIYYAFKQAESASDEGTSSTGWETFLDAVIRSGFGISGTLPMRTERQSRSIGIGTNALASSIVLVCRKRDLNAPTATRREFVQALEAELAPALKNLQESNIAPVDLAQAAIGPGMAVYTRYAKVLDAEGNALTVKQALALINEKLDTVLAEQEGDFDADTRWALAWFEQVGFSEGEYGLAETLSKAKNTSVQGMVDAGAVKSGAGKVRLLRPEELLANWSPDTNARLTEWEIVHQLIRALSSGGETGAAELVAKLGSRADTARELAYRLYVLCERKKRAQEALTYNALVQSWPEIQRLASERETKPAEPTQTTMFS
jgi:putative DNA methylase